MSEASFTRPRRPSNNYRHGLTSRARAEGWSPDADLLARELVRGAPRAPEIIQTARLLSGQLILLQAIRKERRRLLMTPPPAKGIRRLSDLARVRRYQARNPQQRLCEGCRPPALGAKTDRLRALRRRRGSLRPDLGRNGWAAEATAEGL